MKRPVIASVRSFVLWAAGILVVSTAVDRLLRGDGVGGLIEAVFGFVWVGWLAVLAVIPIWLGFRWLLDRFGPRMSGPIRFRGAVIGLVWWVTLAVLLLSYELVAWPFSPDSQPTALTVVSGLAVVGALGSILGFLEGRAIERSRVTFAGAD